jgi:ATP-dependent DNA helicase HFM1/MER3
MTELDESEILQMIGRAGRPQFEDTGVAVILTRSDKRKKYENIAGGNMPLESRLHLQLAEHINAEIALGQIFDVTSAKQWLRSSFFFTRCQSNPSHYGIASTGGAIEDMIDMICSESIKLLKAENMVDSAADKILHTTIYGDAASRYCVRLPTMRHILSTKEQASLKDVVCPVLLSLMYSLRLYPNLTNLSPCDSDQGNRDFTILSTKIMLSDINLRPRDRKDLKPLTKSGKKFHLLFKFHLISRN